MTIKLEPETGVPLFDDDPAVDLNVRVQAAKTTALELAEHGLELKPNKEDEDVAAKLAIAYADDPEKTSKKATNKRMANLTPASLVLTGNILTEFGASVVESAFLLFDQQLLYHYHHLNKGILQELTPPDQHLRLISSFLVNP